MAAFHRESRSDPTVPFLEWCGEHLEPQGTTLENIHDAGGDVVTYELMLARKKRKLHGEPTVTVKEVLDGWEDCKASKWERTLQHLHILTP